MSALQKEAKQYFNSKLRKYDYATDIALHNSLRSILNGTKKGELVDLRYGADHRINEIMGTATLYKDYLGIEYPDCHKVDTGRIFKTGYRIESLIGTYPLFNSRGYYGHPYLKGKTYLAHCISTQEWSKSESETIAKLDSLVKYRDAPTCPLYEWGECIDPKYPRSGVPNIKGTSRLMETISQFRLSRDDRIRDTIWNIGQVTDRRVRSLSSNTCRRKHLTDNEADQDVTAGTGKLSLEDRSSCKE